MSDNNNNSENQAQVPPVEPAASEYTSAAQAQPTYPPAAQQQGYPPQQQGGYPSQQQQGYPPQQQGGYPPQQQQGGYPPQQYGGYPQQAYPQQNYYAAPQASNNSLALVSLIASILGVTLLPGLGSIVGIITGHMATSQIRKSGEGGAGMAKAGTIIGYVGLILVILFILLIFVFAASFWGSQGFWWMLLSDL